MFGYYGGKSKIIHRYPAPTENLIIEPFAGGAQYALQHWYREVLLVDKYEVVVRIWQWLKKCSPLDILGIRCLEYGQNVDDFEWSCDEEKWLMGFLISAGVATPRKTPSKWTTLDRPNAQKYKLNRIADNLQKIRHWKIQLGDYKQIPNQKATWFIDPPYVDGGYHYKHNSLSYDHLGAWCKERQGQVVVCEKATATWLPFSPICTTRGVKKTYSEGIWNREVIYG